MSTRSLTLQLIHGRASPIASLNDWGFDADPIQGVAFLHGTYMTSFTIGFVSAEACEHAMQQTGWRECDELILEVSVRGDLIQCGDAYFGDFELLVAS